MKKMNIMQANGKMVFKMEKEYMIKMENFKYEDNLINDNEGNGKCILEDYKYYIDQFNGIRNGK